ncbi:MAG: hypothetical protein HYY09_05060 [Firmicutes bacterium]|nr:hypothetical protein [Bacillota bacterium]
MNWRKSWLVLLIVALLVTAAVSCKKKEEAPKAEPKAAQEQPKAQEPKKEEPKKEEPKVIDRPVVIGIGGEPNNLDPYSLESGNMRFITENIFEPLVRQNRENFEVAPLLATRWEPIDKNTWRFWLRNDVKFHNGEPLNAEAVVFSVKRVLGKDIAYDAGIKDLFAGISDAKVVEPYMLDLITSDPLPTIPIRMAWLPIMEPKHVQAVGKDIGEKPVGTGPYKLEKWTRGSQIELVRNDEYWGGKPGISKATFKLMHEDAARLMALRNGELHIAHNMLPEYKDQLPGIKTISSIEFPGVRIAAENPLLKDKRVRQALNYAIDRQAIVDNLLSGYGKVSQCQNSKPEFPGHNTDLKAVYDPEKAKQLLKEGGYKGEKLEFVGTRGRWLKDGEMTEALGAMLKDVGINVEVKVLEFSKYLDVFFDQANPVDLIFIPNGNDIGDQDRFFSGYVISSNRMGTYRKDIPEIDKAINEARHEMDINKRNQMYKDLWAQMCDDPPFIFIMNYEDIYGVDPNLDWEPRQDIKILVKDIKWKK